MTNIKVIECLERAIIHQIETISLFKKFIYFCDKQKTKYEPMNNKEKVDLYIKFKKALI